MFSLEGLPPLHDTIHDKQGAFSSVEESIKQLNFLRARLLRKKQRFGLLLNTVVSNQNIDDVIPLMTYVQKRILVDSHLLSPMRGDPKEPSLLAPSGEAFTRLTEQAKPFFDTYTRRGTSDEMTRTRIEERLQQRYALWSDLLSGGQLPFPCQAGNRIGVLEPDGDVRLCESFPVIGNVRERDFDFSTVWFSPAGDESRDQVDGCSCTHGCFIGASEPPSATL
ncbi:hypothetical protein [Candidatus Reidiella endopervernicosa]|nr:hypothetical protein [Candidatus Reidiella endopervernicosa]QKQ26927.1 hypothetical protein HUE57_12030 [Candidatus Reidiella endopervernicosa]